VTAVRREVNRDTQGHLQNTRAGVKCEVVKYEVPVRGINARRWVICEAGMCEAQRTTGAAGVVVGCEPLKR